MADDTEARIPTNLRLLLILETLVNADAPLTSTEIGRRVGLGKPTAHRLCATLLDEGFLDRAGAGKRLAPGPRARALARGVQAAASQYIVLHQVLERVARAVGETVNYVVPRADGMTYADRVETNWPFRVQLPVGSSVPFHCTASGKVYLASLAPRRRERVVRSLSMTAMTDSTLTDPDALLAELAAVARRGYAMDREELYEGMIAIAAPVLSRDGAYIASLAVHGPKQRLSPEQALSHLPLLQAAAAEIGLE